MFPDIILKNAWICNINLVSALCSTTNVWETLHLVWISTDLALKNFQCNYDKTTVHYIELLCSCKLYLCDNPQQPIVWIWGCQWTAEFFFFFLYPGYSFMCLMIVSVLFWFQCSSVFPPVKAKEWHASVHMVRINWWWQDNDNGVDGFLALFSSCFYFFLLFLDQWTSHL